MRSETPWRGYSRDELGKRREAVLSQMRVELVNLDKGIQNVRRNNIVKTFDILKRLARVAGYMELFAFGVKIWRRFAKIMNKNP